jgi:hypothetical protein
LPKMEESKKQHDEPIATNRRKEKRTSKKKR